MSYRLRNSSGSQLFDEDKLIGEILTHEQMRQPGAGTDGGRARNESE